MTEFVATQNLSKSFRSGFWGSSTNTPMLTDVNFTVQAGAIVGLLGRNGAGKTTLLRCLLGLLKPDAGTCSLFGEPSWNATPAVRQRIGFVPQRLDAYLWMTLDDMIDFFGGFYTNWDSTYVNQPWIQ